MWIRSKTTTNLDLDLQKKMENEISKLCVFHPSLQPSFYSTAIMAALQMSYAFSKLTSVSETKGATATANHSSKHNFQCGLSGKSRFRSLACSNMETAVPEPTENIAPPASPHIDFIFVSPEQPSEGEFEVQRGPATGGQKLRNIMVDNQLDLYGPYYNLPLLNCGGGGTCGTCLVEILQGKELLSERTNKEKEHLKKRPKTWRLACQTVVGNKDSVGKTSVTRQFCLISSHDMDRKSDPATWTNKMNDSPN